MNVPAKILIVDDVPANVLLLKNILLRSGHGVVCAMDSREAFRAYEQCVPDLVILDLHMPEVDGFELLKIFRAFEPDPNALPILVFTADVSPAASLRALDLGANDFLTKPGIVSEITLRVRNFLRAHSLYKDLQALNAELEKKVRERTLGLWESQVEILERLARVGERGDPEISVHGKRVGVLAAGIATELGMSHAEVELIRLSAPLRDIGRSGLPDCVVTRRAMLSEADSKTLRTHTTRGAEILSGGRTALITMAETIALTHHENWDGTGYPEGLHGDHIPLVGRIVSVADSYDAFTTGNSLGRTISPANSLENIRSQSGKSFDPAVVEALFRVVAAPGR